MKTADGSRKKKPPTFRHLPINRAKKLKQSWVEAQKIKSQWKAQKRKEGIVTNSSRVQELVVDDQENEAASEFPDDAANEGPVEPSHMWRGTASSTALEEPNEGEEGGPTRTTRSADDAAQSSMRRPRLSPSKEQQPHSAVAHPSSLRDLQRQAYSKSSLHTFKSGHRGSDTRDNIRVPAPARGRGGLTNSQRGRDHVRGRGRGQPDMRLRMNAMLEKIKRDYNLNSTDRVWRIVDARGMQ